VRRSLSAPRSQLLVASVAFVLGLLVVVQIRSQTGISGLGTLSSQDLTLLVANLNTRNDQLRTEIASIDRQLETVETGGSRGATSADELRATLTRIRAWAGLDAVGGNGITIVVRGPIDGPAIEDLVNELRNAGAEAIAIEDVRVVPGTVIGGGEGSVSVDDTALDDPFTIRAIGTPASLTGSLTRAGGIVAQMAATHPETTIEVGETSGMILPATARDLIPDHGRLRL
jgi:uncharacterized protein YlxW (UPF0749 family)